MINAQFSFETGAVGIVASESNPIRTPQGRGPEHVNVQVGGPSGRARVEWSNDGEVWEPMKAFDGSAAEVIPGGGKAFLSAPFVRIVILEAGLESASLSFNTPQ